jgi:hypothetical protein
MTRIYRLAIILLIVPAFYFSVGGQEPMTNPHGDIKWDCQKCHSTGSWNILREPLEFDHSTTGFALIGNHERVKCLSCHEDLRFAYIGVECADCHTDVHRSQFGIECQNCHTPHSWQNRQDLLERHASRGFPLVGVHAIVDCEACHIEQGREEFTGAPLDCQGCHQDNFAVAKNPDHFMAGFTADCQTCHPAVASNWRNTTFQHTGEFQIRGAHLSVDCLGCHSESYAGTSRLCYGCHDSDFSTASDPDHSGMGFPTNCEVCHSEVAWENATFDHLASSGFEIRGAHLSISCTDCHVGNQLDLPRDCVGCHRDDYEGVDDPNHVSGNFPEDCTFCHGDVSWTPAQFDHNQTDFPLTGIHQTLNCEACHPNGQFSGTPTDCFACHEDDYNSVQDPNHVSNNFSTDCTLCHTTNGWLPTSFDHAQTQFPLTGAHVGLECIQCHADGYQNTPTDCFACHEDDYNSVVDPNHVTNNFSTDCTMCHSTSVWIPASFDHVNTDFPLTGAHVALECIACHAEGYQNTPTDCFACHEDDYNSVEDPNHVANNFSTDCTMCHSTTAWVPADFDHAQTDFPLTGAHVALECIACHAEGYQNTPTDCFACHEDDYNSVEDPNHVADGFSTDCTECHTTDAWYPVTFDHSQTQFPLTGAHLLLDCLVCHADGYDNTPSDCYACHQGDFNGTVDPPHQLMGFPTNCELCHNTNGWDTSWDHDVQFFPIFSGRHDGEWNICADCHVVPDDFGAFECIFCHEHNQQDTDEEHDGVSGYEYNSQACYNCHPDGEGP